MVEDVVVAVVVVVPDVFRGRRGWSSAGMLSGVGSGSWDTKSQYPPEPFPPGTGFCWPSPTGRGGTAASGSVLPSLDPDLGLDSEGKDKGNGGLDGVFLPSTNTAIRPEQDDVVTTPGSWLIEFMRSRIGASREPLGERSV